MLRFLNPVFQKQALLFLPLALAVPACSAPSSEDYQAVREIERQQKREAVAQMNALEREEATTRLIYMVRNFCRDDSLTEDDIRQANGGEDILLADSLGCPKP
ncbi:MAG: hypothetical protein AB7E85_01690 [Pseudobdellovibrionaceae bacterium]